MSGSGAHGLVRTSKGFRGAVTTSGFATRLRGQHSQCPRTSRKATSGTSRNEYIRFLKIAKGSCGELRTQLYIAVEVAMFDSEAARQFLKEAFEISRVLQALISRLEAEASSPS